MIGIFTHSTDVILP